MYSLRFCFLQNVFIYLFVCLLINYTTIVVVVIITEFIVILKFIIIKNKLIKLRAIYKNMYVCRYICM